jgi:hypothetical protein
MYKNGNLFNAVVVGENPEASFIIDGKHLHAVEKSVADLKKDKSDSKVVLPLIREALKDLIQFSQGKIESHFLNVDLTEGKPDEQTFLVKNIHNIFSHLPHSDRNELSSLIHHKQSNS